jgi:hypothetical protein
MPDPPVFTALAFEKGLERRGAGADDALGLGYQSQ